MIYYTHVMHCNILQLLIFILFYITWTNWITLAFTIALVGAMVLQSGQSSGLKSTLRTFGPRSEACRQVQGRPSTPRKDMDGSWVEMMQICVCEKLLGNDNDKIT